MSWFTALWAKLNIVLSLFFKVLLLVTSIYQCCVGHSALSAVHLLIGLHDVPQVIICRHRLLTNYLLFSCICLFVFSCGPVVSVVSQSSKDLEFGSICRQ
jgi:hypothetical protein